VRDYKLTPRFGDLTFLRTAASITLDALGLSAIARHVEQAGVIQASIAWGSTACWRCGVRPARIEPPKSGFRPVLPHCEWRHNPNPAVLSRDFAPPNFI